MALDRLHLPLYEPAEVARMLRITPSRVRRWLFGYEFRVGADKRRRKQRPVVRRTDVYDARIVTFLDLMDLLGAKSFLDEGISLQKVRRAFDEAATILGADHPFARGRFFTSGGGIYLEMPNRTTTTSAPNLLHLLSGGQWAIGDVIRQCGRQIEFDEESDLPLRWFPLGKQEPVVVDPRICFGAPAVVGRGIKTSNVYDFFRAEGNKVSRAQDWFRLTKAQTEAAIAYEKERLARAVAA